MERAAVEGKVDKLISEDMRFHRTICELSGHRKLLEIWLTLERQLRTFITLEEYYYEKADQFARTHHPVLEAIKSGNINIAERSIRDHLYQALDFIKRKYGKAFSKSNNYPINSVFRINKSAERSRANEGNSCVSTLSEPETGELHYDYC